MGITDYRCAYPGCGRTPLDGPLFRISAMGEAFVGACGTHFHHFKRKPS